MAFPKLGKIRKSRKMESDSVQTTVRMSAEDLIRGPRAASLSETERSIHSVNLDLPAEPPVIADRRTSFFRETPTAAIADNLYRDHLQPITPANIYRDPQASLVPASVHQQPNITPGTSGEESFDYETDATSLHSLPALQTKGPGPDWLNLEPLIEDDPSSFDLIQPPGQTDHESYSLESRAELIFSADHLKVIFADSKLLLKFTTFLGLHRPQSVPLLIYYLDARKALAAINYANAVAEALDPLASHEFTSTRAKATANVELEARADQAFAAMVKDDLPAFVTYCWINVVSVSIRRRITGTMPPHLRDASEGLAEVFCLSDPSREDNPIVFASEEFHRTTQYGVSYAIGRNCRFLQGPRTNRDSVRRLREAISAGKDTCETFINYRRDGSPFMNLLMTAPLRDSRGNLRYFIGAQVDVSGLAKECTELDAAQRLISDSSEDETSKKDEIQELCEMFNQTELEVVRRSGGSMHREQLDDDDDSTWHRPRLLLKDPSAEDGMNELRPQTTKDAHPSLHGRLVGVYQHYLLVRPYPSLRILFASPSLRIPGMLQSPFMSRIGSSERVRDELVSALAEGRGVTAKIRWVSRHEDEGRNRWIHCTPLLGSNGQVGVWMVVLIDDSAAPAVRRFREAPPVAKNLGNVSVRGFDRASLRSAADAKASPGRERGVSPGLVGSGILREGNEYEL